MGNIAVQLMSLGYIKDLKDARQVIINSFPVKEFLPAEDTADWDAAYEEFKKYLL
jgi:rhamnulokinase/L-fuculokinase